MTNFHKNHPVDSILTVKASGSDLNIDQDLSMPIGKSIAELLYDEENNQQEKNQTTNQENQEAQN